METINRFATKADVRKLAEGYGVVVVIDHDERTMLFHGLRAQEAIDSVNQMFTVAFPMKVAE